MGPKKWLFSGSKGNYLVGPEVSLMIGPLSKSSVAYITILKAVKMCCKLIKEHCRLDLEHLTHTREEKNEGSASTP